VTRNMICSYLTTHKKRIAQEKVSYYMESELIKVDQMIQQIRKASLDHVPEKYHQHVTDYIVTLPLMNKSWQKKKNLNLSEISNISYWLTQLVHVINGRSYRQLECIIYEINKIVRESKKGPKYMCVSL